MIISEINKVCEENNNVSFMIYKILLIIAMTTERKVKLAERALWWRGYCQNIHNAKIKACEDK